MSIQDEHCPFRNRVIVRFRGPFFMLLPIRRQDYRSLSASPRFCSKTTVIRSIKSPANKSFTVNLCIHKDYLVPGTRATDGYSLRWYGISQGNARWWMFHTVSTSHKATMQDIHVSLSEFLSNEAIPRKGYLVHSLYTGCTLAHWM